MKRSGAKTSDMKQWQAGRLEGLFSSKKREYALVILFFFLLAILFTWPLILHPHNGILGGRGDPLLNSWIISWDAKTMFTDPAALFQGNIIYPSRDVLAYSEHQFTLGLIAAPVYFIFRNPILAYNFVIFFSFVFAAFGCYLLVKELTGSRWGGLVAGSFYAFLPYLIAQLSHIQIFFAPFLPFMLLYLYRYLGRGRWRDLVLFGVFFVAQSLASWHYLMYSALAAGLLWLWAVAVAASTGLVVGSVGYAQKEKPANSGKKSAKKQDQSKTEPATASYVCESCDTEFASQGALNAHGPARCAKKLATNGKEPAIEHETS